ncbi:MAG: coenzyme F420 hydrogenase [Nitrospirae bacterium]|nr:coenzyme F420 hydrogenase [Nitrospirota bacterium]
MIKRLQEKVGKLLREKKVALVIGYEMAGDGISTTPCFIEREDEVERLVWNEHCVYNLSRYLIETRELASSPSPKIGVVAKGCDVKSIIGLIQENQIKRDEVVIIGMECEGQFDVEGERQFKVEGLKLKDKDKDKDKEGKLLEKCKACEVHIPKVYDLLIKDDRNSGAPEPQSPEVNAYAQVEELEGKSQEERWQYWKKEFARCIKCYACRQVCPLCFCPQCIADQTLPQWISPSPSLKGNTTWNIVRAFHLAGRCIDCGECERACPMKIPLRKINKKLGKEIKEMFDYEAGLDSEAKPPLADFKLEDPEEFIR